MLLSSCGKSFLERDPQGELPESQVINSKGIEASLIGAYGILNGNVNGTWGNYASAPSQWLFGEVGADNAHKGSEATDQPNMNMIEFHTPNSSNDNLSTMWEVYYEGVSRANNTLRLLKLDQAGGKPLPLPEQRKLKPRQKCYVRIITSSCGEFSKIWLMSMRIPQLMMLK